MPELTGAGGGGKRTRYLIFSVDTEPDDPMWTGPRMAEARHENLRAIRGLCSRLGEIGAKPTFLCSHTSAAHPDLIRGVEALLGAGRAEIGAHFHPGDTPPFGPWDGAGGDNLMRMTDEALEEKFARLHAGLTARFGTMTSYRSAAWSIDARLVALLIRHGYRVDSSVTPGVSWAWIGRPSYLEAPNRAYRLDPRNPARPGDSPLLEVPVSIWIPRRWSGSMTERLGGHLFTMPMAARVGLLARGLRALRPPPPMWLRPAFMDLGGMKETARRMGEEDYLHVMCHSNELWPGTSPYVATEDDVDRVRRRLEGFLEWALDEGYIPVTLSEYAAAVSGTARLEARPVDAGGPRPGGPAAPRKRNPWAVAAKGVVSLAILAGTWRLFDLDHMRALLGKASPWLALACLAAILVDIEISAFKVSLLTEPGRVPAGRIFRFNLIKILFNNLLPGGVGGEAARVMCLSREIGSVSESAALVVWDRLSGLWAQILFSVLSVPLLVGPEVWPHFRLGFCAAGLAAAAALSFLLAPPPGLLARVVTRVPGLAAGGFYMGKVERFAARWRAISQKPGRILRLIGFSVLGQLSMILIVCLAAAALGGRISFWQASPIVLGGALSSLVPFTLGGLGVTEAAYALGFSLMGSHRELGFLAALLIRAICLLPALLGWAVMVREQILPFKAAPESG